VPERALREIPGVAGELEAPRLPAHPHADPREDCAQRVLDRWGFVGRLGDLLKQQRALLGRLRRLSGGLQLSSPGTRSLLFVTKQQLNSMSGPESNTAKLLKEMVGS
jgi:hypothetical protein